MHLLVLSNPSLTLMKNKKNLINFFLCRQQNKQKTYEIIALFTQLCWVWNKWVSIATNRFCLKRLIYAPVLLFSDVIRHHIIHQIFCPGVIRRHHFFVCREKYNIYIDAWKQQNLCVKNNTILTQMLENKRTLVSPWQRVKSHISHVTHILSGAKSWDVSAMPHHYCRWHFEKIWMRK